STIDVVTINAWNRGSARDGQPYWRATSGIRRLSMLDIIGREDRVSIMSVFRRIVIETVGVFDETMRRSEDYDLWLRIAAAGFGFLQLLEPLGWYQRRPD